MKLEILIGLNLLINGFIAGGYYEDQKGCRGKELFFLCVAVFLLCSVGTELMLISILWGLVLNLIRYLGRLTQLPFYWSFYVSGKYKTIDQEQWERLDYFWDTLTAKVNEQLITKHILFCFRLLHKRHNHTPKSPIQYKEEDRIKRLGEYNDQQISKYLKAYSEEKDIGHDEDDNNFPKHKCGAILTPGLKEGDLEYNNCYWCGSKIKEETEK